MNTPRTIVKYELDGAPVYVEIETDDDLMLVARDDSGVPTAQARFIEALAHVRPAVDAVLDAFRAANRPSEIALEFGVKFNVKLGAVLASADSEATFKVNLKWVNPKPDAG